MPNQSGCGYFIFHLVPSCLQVKLVLLYRGIFHCQAERVMVFSAHVLSSTGKGVASCVSGNSPHALEL